jgi:hypothetical protein
VALDAPPLAAEHDLGRRRRGRAGHCTIACFQGNVILK